MFQVPVCIVEELGILYELYNKDFPCSCIVEELSILVEPYNKVVPCSCIELYINVHVSLVITYK